MVSGVASASMACCQVSQDPVHQETAANSPCHTQQVGEDDHQHISDTGYCDCSACYQASGILNTEPLNNSFSSLFYFSYLSVFYQLDPDGIFDPPKYIS